MRGGILWKMVSVCAKETNVCAGWLCERTVVEYAYNGGRQK